MVETTTYTKMHSDTAKKKRLMYRRSSHTSAAVLVLNHNTDVDDEGISEQSRLLQASDSPPLSPDTGSEHDKSDEEFRYQGDKGAKSSHKGKRCTIYRTQTSKHDLKARAKTVGEPVMLQYTPEKSDRKETVKSPTIILSKVKERIRKTVFQSTEWPNAHAMMQERRQKEMAALMKSKERLSMADGERMELREINRSASRESSGAREWSTSTGRSGWQTIRERYRSSRTVSVPVEDITSREAIKYDFQRRRSISDDTYDRSNRRPSLLQANAGVGVICSNEDLQLILSGQGTHQLHPKSVSSSRNPSDSQLSVESGTGTMSSRSMDSGTGRSDSDAGAAVIIHVYPDIVLDDKAKDDLANMLQDSQSVKECEFDENGQTWDIYGADFDPDVLGGAIQKRLEKLMVTSSIDGDGEERDRKKGRRHTEGSVGSSRKSSKSKERPRRSSDNSFWLKLLCLFSEREVTS